ncbi:hypothetical protein ACYPKM_00840 [Pseudomonas aeruginosa]
MSRRYSSIYSDGYLAGYEGLPIKSLPGLYGETFNEGMRDGQNHREAMLEAELLLGALRGASASSSRMIEFAVPSPLADVVGQAVQEELFAPVGNGMVEITQAGLEKLAHLDWYVAKRFPEQEKHQQRTVASYMTWGWNPICVGNEGEINLYKGDERAYVRGDGAFRTA